MPYSLKDLVNKFKSEDKKIPNDEINFIIYQILNSIS